MSIKKKCAILALLAVLNISRVCCGFVLGVVVWRNSLWRATHTTCLQRTPSFRLKGKYDHDDEEALSRARNDARTDVRNLLTQRTFQSFMFLCERLRDPHTVQWIEDFLETSNSLWFHGTGAAYIQRFGGTWDGPLNAMLDRPKDVVIVRKKRMKTGHKGLTNNPTEKDLVNPYVEERYDDFEIEIDPVSLTSRLLAVREQIAKEWVTDLDILQSANSQIMDSYFNISKREQAKSDEELEESPPSIAFERIAAGSRHLAVNDGSSSPFRPGNFDLLYNLCTHASTHRLLREFRDAGPQKEVSFVFLRDFYQDRLPKYFDGDQKYGRADDFLEELLLSSPSVVISDDDKEAGLADPMGIAEQIIEMRTIVIEEWKALMKQVPQDHAIIRKELLDKQMAAWGQDAPLGSDTSSEEFQ